VTKALERWLPELGTSLTDELSAAWFEAEEKHFSASRRRARCRRSGIAALDRWLEPAGLP
jgi:hypothetical protein